MLEIAMVIRCAPWPDRRVGNHLVAVAYDGEVYVWDGKAGEYTTAHVLTKRQQRRIYRLAKRELGPRQMRAN